MAGLDPLSLVGAFTSLIAASRDRQTRAAQYQSAAGMVMERDPTVQRVNLISWPPFVIPDPISLFER